MPPQLLQCTGHRPNTVPHPTASQAQGLWRGTVPGQLLTVPYTAVQFVALQQCRALARQYGLSDSPRWQSAVPFVSGALAGAAATVASYPFDLLRTTLAAQGEPPVYATMTDAGAAQGWMRLWVGGGASCILCRTGVLKGTADAETQSLVSLQLLPSAVVAAMLLCLLLRLLTSPLHARPTLCVARGIVRQHGVRGLYRGLGVTVLEIMPYAALQFGLYDVFNKAANKARVRSVGVSWRAGVHGVLLQLLAVILLVWHRRDVSWLLNCMLRLIQLQVRLDPAHADEPPSSLQAFVCGLAAGMLAKLGTHPLDVAKKRFQVS